MDEPDDLHELERALLDGIRESVPASDRGGDRTRVAGAALYGPGAEPPCSTTPRAGCAAGHGLLHDRVGGPREQRRGRAPLCARPTRRCSTTAPVRSTSPGPSRLPGHDPVRDVLAGMLAAGRRADRRRPPQGVRPSRPGGDPADLDDRVAPAARARCGVRDRTCPRGSACRRRGPPTRSRSARFGDASANHSTAQGAINAACYTRPPGPAAAAAVRVRGQRSRASASRRRQGGSRPHSAGRPALRYAHADGTDPVGVSRGADRARRPRARAPAGRRCCTCGPCATWATPAPTSSRATAAPPSIRGRFELRPDPGTGARCSSRTGRGHRPSSSTST